MRHFFILLTLFGSIMLSAQKIKVKKGNILLDKAKIGSVEKYRNAMGQLVRKVSDLNGLSADIVRDTKDTMDNYDDDVYLVTTNFNSGTMEVHPYFIKAQPLEKGLVLYFMDKGFWTASGGMDERLLNSEMQSNIALVNEANANEDRVKALDPFVKRNGEIVIGGYEGTEVIGYVESPNHYLQTLTDPIKIYDLDKNLIAKGTSKILKDEEFRTFDGQEHRYKIKNELNEILKPLFLSEVVYELLLGGYIYDGKKPYQDSQNIFK